MAYSLRLHPKLMIKTTPTEMVRLTQNNLSLLVDWTDKKCRIKYGGDTAPVGLVVKTTEGDMIAYVGDWVAKDVSGNPYPIDDAIVQASYKEVEW